MNCSLLLFQTAHRGPSAKQPESQSDASNPVPAPANTSSLTSLKSKSSGKPENSDGEDWGREQEEEEEEEEEDDDDDDGDEDYEAPGTLLTSAGGGTQPSAQTEWTCPQCQTTFTDNEDYLSHVKMEHGKVWHSDSVVNSKDTDEVKTGMRERGGLMASNMNCLTKTYVL